MAAFLEQHLDDCDMTLVHCNVQWSLLLLVTGIQICIVLSQKSYHLRLVPQSGMVDSLVTILILEGSWGAKVQAKEGEEEDRGS